jgi:acetylornithine deacetylase
MESALWEAAGVPTVVCGPAGGGMHAAGEWVDLAQVRAYADALVGTIREFCGPATALVPPSGS